MIKLELLVRAHLDSLKKDHPERALVNDQVDAIAAFNASRLTPELLTAHFRDVWTQRGGRIGKTYDVPDLSATPDQLAEIYRGGRRISLVPRGIILEDLGRIFPDMRSWATSKGTTIKSDHSEGGYLAVETSLDAPNLGSDEGQLRTLFKSQGRQGMTLPTYIIASQDSKLLTGHYLDEKTWSRLLGSRDRGGGGRVISAYFDSGGDLDVRSPIGRRFRDPGLGGRSEEAIGAYNSLTPSPF